jgi:hypothetical protein
MDNGKTFDLRLHCVLDFVLVEKIDLEMLAWRDFDMKPRKRPL